MMRSLANKKNVKTMSFIVAIIFVFGIAGMAVMQMGSTASAAPSTSIGVLDKSRLFSADNKELVEINKELQTYVQDKQKEFEEKAASLDEEGKSKLYAEITKDIKNKQEEMQKGLTDKISKAVGSVADKKGLTLVVNKQAVLYGGVDITEEVTKALSSK